MPARHIAVEQAFATAEKLNEDLGFEFLVVNPLFKDKLSISSSINSPASALVSEPGTFTGHEETPHFTDSIAYEIQKFILNNFTNNKISLEMVAENVFAHPTYVSRVFSRNFKTHFRTYINNLRVEMAADLLVNTEKSIGEICHEVGFSDHSYFNKVFRQLKGMTPSEYRAEVLAMTI